MKKLKNFLVFLIIINIVLLIYLICIKPIKSYDIYEYRAKVIAENANLTPVDENILNEQIISIGNVGVVAQKYSGEIAITKATDKIKNLINGGFKKFYKDTEGMNKATLAKYFDTNKDNIAMQTGLTEVGDFTNFIQKIQIYENEEIKCTNAEIVDNSYEEVENDYACFIVKLSYDNDKELEFNVYLSNSDFRDTPIVIIK